jgi:hypothetical protein
VHKVNGLPEGAVCRDLGCGGAVGHVDQGQVGGGGGGGGREAHGDLVWGLGIRADGLGFGV